MLLLALVVLVLDKCSFIIRCMSKEESRIEGIILETDEDEEEDEVAVGD